MLTKHNNIKRILAVTLAVLALVAVSTAYAGQ